MFAHPDRGWQRRRGPGFSVSEEAVDGLFAHTEHVRIQLSVGIVRCDAIATDRRPETVP